jgi:hypothetical protein
MSVTSKNFQFLWWLAAGLTMFIVAVVVWNKLNPSFEVGHMPACDAEVAKNLLKSAARNSSLTRLEVLDISDIRPLEGTSEEKRICGALVFTNAGKRQTTYTIEWKDTAKSEIWLEVRF